MEVFHMPSDRSSFENKFAIFEWAPRHNLEARWENPMIVPFPPIVHRDTSYEVNSKEIGKGRRWGDEEAWGERF